MRHTVSASLYNIDPRVPADSDHYVHTCPMYVYKLYFSKSTK